MADITANVDAWSTTEASNQPSGTTSIGTGLDDNLRAIEAGVALWAARLNRVDNLSLAASVASNALTIALKGKDGADPSSTNKIRIPFRNVTAATGDYTQLEVTAATSLVISSGSTLGTSNNTAFRFWIVGFNDGGTFRLGAINCTTVSSGTVNIYPLSAWGIASSTAEGGAGGADSAQTFYTGTAVTSKAYRVLGYVSYESGLATAGTYASAPTRVQIFDQDTRLPGERVQVCRTASSGAASGTTQIPYDNSIPQNTEGDEYLSRAITPTSAANILQIGVNAIHRLSGDAVISGAIFQDSTANAVAAAAFYGNSTGGLPFVMDHWMVAGTSSATTFKYRAGPNTAVTLYLNANNSGTGIFNGTAYSHLAVTEIMS